MIKDLGRVEMRGLGREWRETKNGSNVITLQMNILMKTEIKM